MPRDYIAVICPPGDESDPRHLDLIGNIGAHTGLPARMSSKHVTVFASSDLPIQSLGSTSGSCILGTLFKRDSGNRGTWSLSPVEQNAILSGAGRALVAEYWGRYVAILIDENRGAVRILRDPSGSLACLSLKIGNVSLVTSNIGLLVGSGVWTPEIDWEAVGIHLSRPQLRTQRTCLQDVIEVPAGFGLRLDCEQSRLEEWWTPWIYAARSEQLDDEVTAIRLVREAILDSVATSAAEFDHIILGLSGGLDSSIVASALAHSGAKFSCATLYTRQSVGDERTYARAMAKSVGTTLYECLEAAERVDITACAAPHLPRPVARSFAQSGDQEFRRLAKETGADAFFGGGGGDNVFCYSHSASPVADRLLMNGLIGGLRTAKDVALLTQSSFWTAISMGVKRAYCRTPEYRWPIDASFLKDRDTVWRHDEIPHPWLEAPRDALPGKALHIAWILGFQNHLEGFGRERILPKISPLMSQPVLEQCLRVPSWMWCFGGRNRAIARAAFSDDLPDIILNRRTKGSPDGFAIELFERNREQIRDLLCGGLLAEHQVIDPAAVEEATPPDQGMTNMRWNRLLMLADVEAWARSWSNRAQA